MARALCELQLELRSCSAAATEDFHPKIPQTRGIKRKPGRGNKQGIELAAKLSEDASPCINDDTQPELPQENEQCAICGSLSSHSPPPSNTPSDPIMTHNRSGDFPIPEELANLDVKCLAERCSLGYRAQRIVSLAKSIMDGALRLKDLEQTCDGHSLSSYEEMEKQLSSIDGFGPFTRANVLMCMGFYNRIPADTETVRHLKMVCFPNSIFFSFSPFHPCFFGILLMPIKLVMQVHARSCTIQTIDKRLAAIYGKYGQFQFLAYW